MFKEKLLKDALRLYAGQHVLDRVLQQGQDALQLASETRQMTVLWIDIRGYTDVTLELTPQKLRHAIVEHHQRVLQCIERHGGLVDGFVGDSVLALWGVADSVDHARSALACANELLGITDPAEAGIRVIIGLESGPVHLGNFGTPDRAKFTVMGDTVNLANRLCLRCVEYNVSALFTDATLALAGDIVPVSHVENIRIKGRDGLIGLYTLGADYARPERKIPEGL
jgi:adenylate cyclase